MCEERGLGGKIAGRKRVREVSEGWAVQQRREVGRDCQRGRKAEGKVRGGGLHLRLVFSIIRGAGGKSGGEKRSGERQG